MKITTDDYTTIATAITDMPEGASMRQRWDALWRAVDAGRLDYGTLKPYNDDHIDTALRRIAQ